MKMMIDKKQIIIALKKVREERQLNIDQIYEIVDNFDHANAPSRSTIARVFAEGSEEEASHFKFETSLKPICDALLDIDTDESNDTADDLAYKSLLRYKKDMLEIYSEQLKEAKSELKTVKEHERNRYNKKEEELKNNFEKSMEFVKNQIVLKDERITDLMADRKLFIETNNELTKTNAELIRINNELVKQLMNCPLKKGDD